MKDKMRVVITGTSRGIGLATAIKFLEEGHEVFGIDVEERSIPAISRYGKYEHFRVDVRDKDDLPYIPNVNILINNAGTQNNDDIGVNLIGAMNVTEWYGIQSDIRSIVHVASASAHTGAEFPEYCASKGGLVAYSKNVALRVAEFGATCNSISPGGVITEMNAPVLDDKVLWDRIMELTPLKRWATAKEIAEWIYFISVTNKFMTGQDILVDGGESTDAKFVWKY